MKFVELNEKEYDKFLDTYENKTFLQSIEMAHVNEQTDNEVCYLGVKENNSIISASLFIIKKNSKNNKQYYYSPRGLQLDYNNDKLLKFYIAELKKYVKDKSGYMIKIDPNVELYSRDSEGNKTTDLDNSHIIGKLNKFGFKYLNFSIQKKWFYVLNLKDRGEDEIFNNFRSTVKNIIRKCQKIGIEIEETEGDFTRFSKIVEETADRKNFSVRDEKYYSLMKKEFNKNLIVLVAKLNINNYLNILNSELNELIKNKEKIKGEGKIKNHEENINNIKNNINKIKDIQNKYGDIIDLAASMFCLYGKEVIYLFSGSKEEFLFLNAPYLLQWHMIKKSIEKNYPIYNFYGIEDLSDPNIKKRGIFEFKKGFNGNVIETIGELDLYLDNLNKLKYYIKKIMKKIWNKFDII